MSHSIKFIKVVTPLAFAIALAACGGGASFGSAEEGEKVVQSQTVDSIDLQAESLQLVSDGSQPIKIIAIAKNEFNNAISDAEITLAVDKSATLTIEDGVATLTPNGSPLGLLTITATSGTVTKTIQIEVIDTVTQAESDIKLGASDGDTFRVGELDIFDTDLKASGKTSIKVSLVDSTNGNELFGEETLVTFNSSCVANGLASLSTVVFTSGVATVDYEAKGCAGVDTVTATAIVDGKAIKASSDINIEAAVVGSLSFNTAIPENIGLKGMGLNEVSTVTFTALDVEGNPVINQDVTFSLSTETGGITLTSTTAKTDANGQVNAKVHSGTKATSVKVKATITIDGKEIKTESRGLVISTGVADQNSFSLSVDSFNPEALNYDGVTANFSVQAADHFNNPVPSGTAIYFTAEAGSIAPLCLTDDKGSCSVEWRSGGTRPTDGRVTVLASMQGEESFVDTNGNGVLDDNETFTDLPEVFRDDNQNNVLDGTDELNDYNEDGIWTDKNGKYNGLLCNEANTVNICSVEKNVYVSDDIEIVMSGSSATIDRPTTVEISENSSKSFNIDLSDVNEQSLPGGTIVAVSIVNTASEGDVPHTIISEPTWTIPNTNANQPASYSVIVQDGGTGLSSILQIKVTTPKGRVTVAYVNLVEAGTQQEPELAVAMDLSATATQILLDGSIPVNITAVVKDASNVVLSGIPVLFTVGNKGTLNVTGNTAVLTPSSDASSGDQLVVTATVIKSTGNIVRTVLVDVVDTLVVGQAESLELSASSRQLFSAGIDPIVLSAVAKDKNNNPLPNETIIFSVDGNATISPIEGEGEVKTANLTPGLNHPENRILTVTATVGSISKTLVVEVIGTHIDVDGPSSIAINKATEYTFKLQDSADKPIAFKDVVVTSALGNAIVPVGNASLTTDANGELVVSLTAVGGGTETLTGTASGATITKQIEVSGNDFTLASTNSDIDLGASEIITVTWLVDGTPQATQVLSVRTTRGTLNTPTVTTDAAGQATFTITSNTAGTATITAETASGLTTNLTREFVATTPSYLNSQSSPSLISPNKSSTIISKVRDANDNPVKNVKVNFNLTDTVNGQLSNSQAVTDSLGRAEVIYTAGDSSSALEGVKILTELQDFPVITDQVSLTVGGNALRIVLGSDENLGEEGVFYKKTFGVIVTDSAGNPVKEQAVDFTIAATHYNKGYMVPGLVAWGSVITTVCPVEDFDHDGNLDIGEDENNNGTLEPTQAATVTGTGVTDDQGKLTVEVVYLQSEAIWSIQRLTATTVVGGTEFVEHTSFLLNLSADDASDPTILVPNVTITDEDRNGNGTMDTFSEDSNGNGILDIGEDINKNGQLDLVVSEDLNNNGVLDDTGSEAYYVGAYGSSNDCTNPN